MANTNESTSKILRVQKGVFETPKFTKIKPTIKAKSAAEEKLNAEKINKAKAEGRRVIAVGTTSVRTLESVAGKDGFVKETSGNTEIFIYPPYKFKCVDGLITNFHLPKSTLLMLVSAFSSREEVLKVYESAVENKYRFFSFGDACLFI